MPGLSINEGLCLNISVRQITFCFWFWCEFQRTPAVCSSLHENMTDGNDFNLPFSTNTPGCGCYVAGANNFFTRPIQLSNFLQRSFRASYEDFILGILCAMIIALLSDVLYIILYRKRQGEGHRLKALQLAVFVDDLTHFRNPFSSRSWRKSENLDDIDTEDSPHISVALSISTVLGILAILAMEVLAVYISQPFYRDA